MTTDTFLRQVQFLQRYYRVVTLSEAVAQLRSGSVSAPTVVLTFDDGYEDNFLNMRAVTEKTGAPAALFICSGHVTGRDEFQHDHLEGQFGFASLGWEQLRYWQGESIEFGSHTRSHFNCGSCELGSLQNEIMGSRFDMELQLGKPVRLFAFPWGRMCDMSSDAVTIAASGYEYCLSTLEENIFPNSAPLSKIRGRQFLPSSRWELEFALQSIVQMAHSWRWRTKREQSDWHPVTSEPE